jgi:Winged helix DNA-binding domain
VQSQDYPGAMWALAQRLDGWTQAAIDAAFDEGEMIRTHVLRPTWHFVRPEDLRWLLALTGPRLKRGDAHRRRALDLDDDLVVQSAGVIERAIATAGPRTRQELRDALAEAGIEGDAGRISHLIFHAELEALICSGPRRGGAQTFALVDEWVAPSRPRERDEALAELAGRYVAGHGPAQDVDLAWWSGLSLTEARRGLGDTVPRLERETVDGRTFWFAPGDSSAARTDGGATMHLLPNYDELLVAFADRSDGLHPDLPAPDRVAQEILNHVIVRDGLVIGRWWRPTATTRRGITLQPRVGIDASDRRALTAAVERYGEFTGKPVEATGLD